MPRKVDIDNVEIQTERRCGCRDAETGKQLGKRCPKLKGRKPHGKWSWRLRVPDELVPLVGKTQLRGSGFESADAAKKDAETQLSNVRAGRKHLGSLTTGDYLDQWLAGKRRLRPTTRRSYETHIRIYLRPLLGSVPLAGLDKTHIDAAYRRIEANGAGKTRPAGPATIARIHATLRAALNDAVKNRRLDFNPAAGVELPEHQPPDLEPWEARDIGRFLDQAAKDRLGPMYELMALAGLRRGEACGATWDGLDETTGVLVIRQQIVEYGGTFAVWPPKTRSGRRKVDLDATLLGSLALHRLAQDAGRQLIGDAWVNGVLPDQHGKPVTLSGLIFTKPEGGHLDPQYVSNHMQIIARNVGLCATVSADAPAGSLTVDVGRRHTAPERTWTVYRDREPIGQVTVTRCARRRGSGATLTLSTRLGLDLRKGDELGEDLLSRRRLHDCADLRVVPTGSSMSLAA
ncbi:site-specific integrase [Pseudofrankia sp. BMG5.37]|uniref:site-specific integrase n=1 Tax=Pseudofrankia sp. BMG5.37 TaxID=3050035 RepID=UPI002895F11F|nr:site-specific integrase [Pseudofrankia sp. BMG5.37]MDT3445154.1 site-specific integrase [Pseudofrankia sp. BMG5.37]